MITAQQTSEQEADASSIRPAMRTSVYLVISGIGAIIVLAAFQPWAGVRRPGGATFDFASEVVGVDAGGWGAAAGVAGLAIFLLGVLGYFWNPFSDPEAMFIAGFAAATLLGAVVKIIDPASLVDPDGEFLDVEATAAPALWLIALCALLALLMALWILVSRPSAERGAG